MWNSPCTKTSVSGLTTKVHLQSHSQRNRTLFTIYMYIYLCRLVNPNINPWLSCFVYGCIHENVYICSAWSRTHRPEACLQFSSLFFPASIFFLYCRCCFGIARFINPLFFIILPISTIGYIIDWERNDDVRKSGLRARYDRLIVYDVRKNVCTLYTPCDPTIYTICEYTRDSFRAMITERTDCTHHNPTTRFCWKKLDVFFFHNAIGMPKILFSCKNHQVDRIDLFQRNQVFSGFNVENVKFIIRFSSTSIPKFVQTRWKLWSPSNTFPRLKCACPMCIFRYTRGYVCREECKVNELEQLRVNLPQRKESNENIGQISFYETFFELHNGLRINLNRLRKWLFWYLFVEGAIFSFFSCMENFDRNQIKLELQCQWNILADCFGYLDCNEEQQASRIKCHGHVGCFWKTTRFALKIRKRISRTVLMSQSFVFPICCFFFLHSFRLFHTRFYVRWFFQKYIILLFPVEVARLMLIVDLLAAH